MMRVLKGLRLLFLHWFGSPREYWKATILAHGPAIRRLAVGPQEFYEYLAALEELGGPERWAERIGRAESAGGFRDIDRLLASEMALCAAREVTRRQGIPDYGYEGDFAFWDRAACGFSIFVNQDDFQRAREYLTRMEAYARGDRSWMPPYPSSLLREF